ncbi:MAG: acyl-phosphate glycerol 3-phosphate acyltransferase [Omnitrophica bacterium GWA2_52_12]|nr:MAG: acyl-phosphate glycerol 3-phosphate acyltransferase [Omnitrophica bacterium GWA2_52_12]
MTLFLWFLTAYLLGSIPFGLGVGFAVKKADIREHGSGNLGATNVFRVVGKKWGIGVLLLDALKGYAAVALPEWTGNELSAGIKLGLGLTAILAHVFPVWLKFRGGKGVASSLGVFLAAIPGPALLTFLFWGGVFLIFRIISLASLAAAVFFPLAIFLLRRGDPALSLYLGISVLLLLFIAYTHRQNIARLRNGTEKKLF